MLSLSSEVLPLSAMAASLSTTMDQRLYRGQVMIRTSIMLNQLAEERAGVGTASAAP